MTEDEVQTYLSPDLTLRRREDGFYDIFDENGDQAALMDWCVELDRRNDRGGEIGSPYPLTLDEIDSVINPNPRPTGSLPPIWWE